MKTLSISLSINDDEALLLLTKYSIKELEGVIAREAYHQLFALLNELKDSIPYIETLETQELYND